MIGGLIALVALIMISGIIYDFSYLKPVVYQATLVDKWHENGECYDTYGSGQIVCDSDRYGVIVTTNNGLTFNDIIKKQKWSNIPTGSPIVYSFLMGRLGGHYQIEIELNK